MVSRDRKGQIMSDTHPEATVHLDRLKLGTGFHEHERSMVLDRFSGLERRLSSFDPGRSTWSSA